MPFALGNYSPLECVKAFFGLKRGKYMMGSYPQEEQVEPGCVVKHKTIHNGEEELHYVESGPTTGRLVVLLHGFPSFWYTWKYQLGPLARAGYRVVAPDLRGYNLSSKPKQVAAYGRGPVLSDVVKIIDTCGGGKAAAVVGHDWGGNIAWALAHDHPQKLERLAVLNMPHPRSFWAALHQSPQQMRRSWYIFLFQMPLLGETFMQINNFGKLREIISEDCVRRPPEEHSRRHVEAFSHPGALTSSINYYRALFRNHWNKPPTSHDKVEMPVAVIWGEKDWAFNDDLAEPPKDVVPNSHVLRLPQASHWVMWDEPEVVNKRLLEFLSGKLYPDGDNRTSKM
eukprot:jgi/Mesen1/3842/ME000207S02853